MSAKATGLVWDLECPKDYNGTAFRPSHKYVLAAYADHADHNGKSIYPAVHTIAKKTGLDDRTVQRLTNDLEAIGLLVEDGQGPKGTNKWYLPYNEGGGRLSPRQHAGGDINDDSLGDMDSGDIPSGDTVPPESIEPKLNIDIEELKQKELIIEALKPCAIDLWAKTPRTWWDLEAKIRSAQTTIEGSVLVISGLGMEAAMLEARLAKTFNNFLLVNKIGGFTSLTFQE